MTNNEEILNKLQAPFPPEQIKSREGPKKNGQPTYFSYVPTEFLQQRLDSVLGLNWTWTVVASTIEKITKTKAIWENRQKVGEELVQTEQVIVHGRLSLQLPDGDLVHRDAFGGCDLNYGTSAGDPHKIADSNAFKKACDKFGLAKEVGGEEFKNSKSTARSSSPFTVQAQSNTQKPQQQTNGNPFLKG